MGEADGTDILCLQASLSDLEADWQALAGESDAAGWEIQRLTDQGAVLHDLRRENAESAYADEVEAQRLRGLVSGTSAELQKLLREIAAQAAADTAEIQLLRALLSDTDAGL